MNLQKKLQIKFKPIIDIKTYKLNFYSNLFPELRLISIDHYKTSIMNLLIHNYLTINIHLHILNVCNNYETSIFTKLSSVKEVFLNLILNRFYFKYYSFFLNDAIKVLLKNFNLYMSIILNNLK